MKSNIIIEYMKITTLSYINVLNEEFLTWTICHLCFLIYAKIFLDILCKNVPWLQPFHMFLYIYLLDCLSFVVIRYKVMHVHWFVSSFFHEITEYMFLWTVFYSFTWLYYLKTIDGLLVWVRHCTREWKRHVVSTFMKFMFKCRMAPSNNLNIVLFS